MTLSYDHTTEPRWPSTSGSMALQQARTFLVLVSMTTTTTFGRLEPGALWECADGLGTTGSGAERAEAWPVRASGPALAELRRISGLTWDQTARLFGVSRRAAHFWASGQPMTAAHEEHLYRVLDLLRSVRASADVTRSLLLTGTEGRSVIVLLAERRYDEASAALERPAPSLAEVRPRRRAPLSEAAQEARHPLAPELLVGGVEVETVPERATRRPVRTRRS